MHDHGCLAFAELEDRHDRRLVATAPPQPSPASGGGEGMRRCRFLLGSGGMLVRKPVTLPKPGRRNALPLIAPYGSSLWATRERGIGEIRASPTSVHPSFCGLLLFHNLDQLVGLVRNCSFLPLDDERAANPMIDLRRKPHKHLYIAGFRRVLHIEGLDLLVDFESFNGLGGVCTCFLLVELVCGCG